MKKLLSLPPNLVGSFHEITELPQSEWFCTNDPVGKKLGSGGGTTWLLRAAYENYIWRGRVARRSMAASQSKSTGASTIITKRLPKM